VQDTLIDAQAEITVKVPDLEIIGVAGRINRISGRFGGGEPADVSDDLKEVVGSRVGPGIRKIIRGLMEASPRAERVAVLLDECCNGIIMSFTKDVLLLAPKDKMGEKEYFCRLVIANPRMYNSCAALCSDSPLLEGMDPIKESGLKNGDRS
jgi:hypothetical protein